MKGRGGLRKRGDEERRGIGKGKGGCGAYLRASSRRVGDRTWVGEYARAAGWDKIGRR